jgi:hypothetical protein
LLLDAPVEGYGGGGKVFDWSLDSPSVPCPVVLSGGLNPANVTDGVVRVRPWAVDVSSGVESAKGIKDAALMRRFCEAVREADRRRHAADSRLTEEIIMFEYQQPDARGHFGPVNGTSYGGTFVAETLIHALDELKAAYARYARTTPSSRPSSGTS